MRARLAGLRFILGGLGAIALGVALLATDIGENLPRLYPFINIAIGSILIGWAS